MSANRLRVTLRDLVRWALSRAPDSEKVYPYPLSCGRGETSLEMRECIASDSAVGNEFLRHLVTRAIDSLGTSGVWNSKMSPLKSEIVLVEPEVRAIALSVLADAGKCGPDLCHEMDPEGGHEYLQRVADGSATILAMYVGEGLRGSRWPRKPAETVAAVKAWMAAERVNQGRTRP